MHAFILWFLVLSIIILSSIHMWHIAAVHSFCLLRSILWTLYTVCLLISPLMDIWVVSGLELLQIKLPWTFMNNVVWAHAFCVWGKYLGVERLVHEEVWVKLFKKQPSCFPPAVRRAPVPPCPQWHTDVALISRLGWYGICEPCQMTKPGNWTNWLSVWPGTPEWCWT